MSTHNKLGILIEQFVSASADEKEAKKRKDAASMYMKEILVVMRLLSLMTTQLNIQQIKKRKLKL